MTPGNALSGQFMFSTATVCIAPQASLRSIIPATHSIGLTKNVNIQANPTTVDLTQGIRQDVVASVTNRMETTASFEVYEYTSKNLAYGLGLDGAGYTLSTSPSLVTADVAGAATTIVVTGNVASSFPNNSWGFIQEDNGDQVFVFKVASAAFSTNTTLTLAAGSSVPAGMSFTTAARVGPINKIDADPNQSNKYFAVQIVGTSIKDQRPMIITFPKARISRGFGIGFSDSNFGNMPFEVTPLVPLPTDTGYSADFKQMMSVFAP